uniref:Uncharacterized protein n=1 Tax=Anopheles farauti TaxID=69004 RepID=A0A182QTX7_9DIPT
MARMRYGVIGWGSLPPSNHPATATHLGVRWMWWWATVGDGCTSGELMLLCRRMLRDVHHVQILRVVLLRCRRDVLVDRRHDLLRYDRAHLYRVRCRLLMVHGRVSRWATAGRRWLRSRMVLLVRLTRRRCGRGRRRRQILHLGRLRRIVEAILLVEWRSRLEGLRMDGRSVRSSDHLQRVGRHQRLPGGGRYLHLRRTDRDCT